MFYEQTRVEGPRVFALNLYIDSHALGRTWNHSTSWRPIGAVIIKIQKGTHTHSGAGTCTSSCRVIVCSLDTDDAAALIYLPSPAGLNEAAFTDSNLLFDSALQKHVLEHRWHRARVLLLKWYHHKAGRATWDYSGVYDSSVLVCPACSPTELVSIYTWIKRSPPPIRPHLCLPVRPKVHVLPPDPTICW